MEQYTDPFAALDNDGGTPFISLTRLFQAPGNGQLLLDGHKRWEDGTINFLSLVLQECPEQLVTDVYPFISDSQLSPEVSKSLEDTFRSSPDDFRT
jgi:hypothetical protein